MMNRNTISLTTIVVSFSYLFLLQFLLQNIFIDPIEARMGLMNKLKLLALLTLVKKVDVVPFPLPIPIPIHIDTKDEYIYLDSMGHRPPSPYPPSMYFVPTRYSNHLGYSASELTPVIVAPEGRPLRYGDRISSPHHISGKHFTNDLNNDPSSTYRIRKVNRNRPTDSNGPTTERPRTHPSTSSSSSTRISTTKTTPTSTTITTTTTTTSPPPPASTPMTVTVPIENDDRSHPLNENVDLKDIKIIFIPVKNLQNAIQNSNKNEMESDMQKFGEEISKQLKDLPFGDDDDDNIDGFNVDSQSSNNKTSKALYNNNSNNKSMDSWNMIDSNKPKVLKNHYTVEQPITTVTTAMPTTVGSKRQEKPAEYPRTTTTKPPTTSPDSGSPFPIPSLQTRWQQQNSYVPKASYYRAPELKVVHSRAQSPQAYQNNQPKDLEWSITPDLTPPGLQPQSLPDLKPNHIQFLYSITHSNETPPNLQNYVLNRPAFQYPAAEVGLESFKQNQYRRRPLLKWQQPHYNQHESLMQSSLSNPVKIQSKPKLPQIP